jgi:hypothetical protein
MKLSMTSNALIEIKKPRACDVAFKSIAAETRCPRHIRLSSISDMILQRSKHRKGAASSPTSRARPPDLALLMPPNWPFFAPDNI